MRDGSLAKKIQPTLSFDGAIRHGTMQIKMLNGTDFILLELQSYILEGGDLNRMVQFGSHDPIKISDVVFNMASPTDVTNLLKALKKGNDNQAVYSNTPLPLSLVMPRGAQYVSDENDLKGGKIVFPERRGANHFNTETLYTQFSGIPSDAKKTHGGNILVTSQNFKLKFDIMNQYDLEILNPNAYKPVLKSNKSPPPNNNATLLKNKFT